MKKDIKIIGVSVGDIIKIVWSMVLHSVSNIGLFLSLQYMYLPWYIESGNLAGTLISLIVAGCVSGLIMQIVILLNDDEFSFEDWLYSIPIALLSSSIVMVVSPFFSKGMGFYYTGKESISILYLFTVIIVGVLVSIAPIGVDAIYRLVYWRCKLVYNRAQQIKLKAIQDERNRERRKHEQERREHEAVSASILAEKNREIMQARDELYHLMHDGSIGHYPEIEEFLKQRRVEYIKEALDSEYQSICRTQLISVAEGILSSMKTPLLLPQVVSECLKKIHFYPHVIELLRSVDELNRILHSFLPLSTYGRPDKKYLDVQLSEEEIAVALNRNSLLIKSIIKMDDRLLDSIVQYPQAVIETKRIMWYYAVKKPHNSERFQLACNLYGEMSGMLAEIAAAGIYVDGSLGGDILRKNRKKYDALHDNLILKKSWKECCLLTSALMWVKEYSIELEYLQKMVVAGYVLDDNMQQRMEFLRRGGAEGPSIHDIDASDKYLYYENASLKWSDSDIDKFFEKLTYQSKKLSYALVMSEWNQDLSAATGVVASYQSIWDCLQKMTTEEFEGDVQCRKIRATALVQDVAVEPEDGILFLPDDSLGIGYVAEMLRFIKFGRAVKLTLNMLYIPNGNNDPYTDRNLVRVLKGNNHPSARAFADSVLESTKNALNRMLMGESSAPRSEPVHAATEDW